MQLRLILLTLCIIPTACTTTVTPPRAPADPVPVYLTDYGRHSSLLFGDPATDGLKEYSVGDFEWYALNHNTPGDAVRSLLFSPASTLGRRPLDIRAADADAIQQIARATGARTVQRLYADRAKAERLMRHLDHIFYAHRNSLTYNALSGIWFVRTNDTYRAWRNCNHVTAGWLHQLGCRTHGLKAFSKFKVRSDEK